MNENNKKSSTSICLDQQSFKILDHYAKNKALSRSSVVRLLILENLKAEAAIIRK
jgi:hypothetical protein